MSVYIYKKNTYIYTHIYHCFYAGSPGVGFEGLSGGPNVLIQFELPFVGLRPVGAVCLRSEIWAGLGSFVVV